MSNVVVSDPDILGGTSIISGTRVPVSVIFENLADGMTIEDIVDAYPTVSREAITEVLRAASRDMGREGLIKPKETVDRIQQLRSEADAFDDIGPCARDEADHRRPQARMLKTQLPHFDVRAATKLAVGACIVAGLFAYLVNGQDVIRAGICAYIWLCIGWYSGKVLFPPLHSAHQERPE